MIYLRLFGEFFVIGMFTVGGGLATLPLLENLGERTGWFSHAVLADMLAISESTPGPIGVNMATYVGFITGDVLGGIVATLGLVTPSVILVLIVSRLLVKFSENATFQGVFAGIRPVSAGLIFAAFISIISISIFPHTAVNARYTVLFLSVVIAATYLLFRLLEKKFNRSMSISLAALTGIAAVALCAIYSARLPLEFNLLPIHSLIFIGFVAVVLRFKALNPILLIVLGGVLGAVLKL